MILIARPNQQKNLKNLKNGRWIKEKVIVKREEYKHCALKMKFKLIIQIWSVKSMVHNRIRERVKKKMTRLTNNWIWLLKSQLK